MPVNNKAPGRRTSGRDGPPTVASVDMSEDTTDELREQIRDLPPEQRARLLRDVQADRVVRYLELRGEYLDDLDDLDAGSVGLYGPDSPLAEHCREHPDDPLCWVVSPGGPDRESVADQLEARRSFVEQLAAEGLLDVERSLVRPGGGMAGAGGATGAAGMPGPGGWPPRPPGWPPGLPWPPYGPVATGAGRPGVGQFDPIPFPAVVDVLYGRR